MRAKQPQARSKAKEKLSLASNKMNIRRCAVKLRRAKVSSVAPNSNQNVGVLKDSNSLLLAQQTTTTSNTISKVNSLKRANIKESLENGKLGISQQKTKKCVVKIKRIRFDADVNKNRSKLIMGPPMPRNPLLALTSRRAKELGLKNANVEAKIKSPDKQQNFKTATNDSGSSTEFNSRKGAYKKKSEIGKVGISQQKTKKCLVRIKRIHFDADAKKNGSQLLMEPPKSRKPLLTQTSRRAKELGLNNANGKAEIKSPEEEQTTTNDSGSPTECNNVQAENNSPKEQQTSKTTANDSGSSTEFNNVHAEITSPEEQQTSKTGANDSGSATEFNNVQAEIKSPEEQQTFNTAADDSGSSTESTSPRNLANKPNLVTELLFSEDEELLRKPTANVTNQTSTKNTIANKDLQPSEKKQESLKYLKLTHKKRKSFSNRVLKSRQHTAPRRKDTTKKDIYEFLSQSQTSDSDSNKGKKDVASDIIQKLIDEGKVVVTKNVKGKPRALKSRKRNNKPKMMAKKPNAPKIVETENIFNYDHDDDECNQFEELEVFSNVDTNLQSKQYQPLENVDVAHPAAESTFSELARSVLLRKVNNQAETARKNVADGKIALEILQRYNSTPFKPQHKSLQLPIRADFSPIQNGPNEKSNQLVVPNRPKGLFEASTKELPSTSKARNNATNNSNKTLVRSTTTFQELSSIVNELHTTSFSSNDSNAENLPPQPTRSSMQAPGYSGNRVNENDAIHSARQIPNPRRTLQHRSPLKAINIIDIVTLPPYAGPMIANKPKSNENLISEENPEKSKLFGFEEYLNENSLSENETENATTSSFCNNNKTQTKSAKHNISKQLRRLKRLRPKSTLARSTLNSTITKNIFDDNDLNVSSAKGNRNIKEMFCSTMINEQQKRNSTNTTAASDDSDNSNDALSLEKKTAELFGDPETTFNQKSFHRTYERRYQKRKRKLIHQFSDIFETDDEHSDNEEDALNTSFAKEKVRKAKRRQVEEPEKKELDKFVSEFNSMLKEAEDYELIVA